MSEEINYGDAVQVISSAPSKYHPGSKGSICGCRVIRSEQEADAAEQPIGMTIWLIELANGESFEAPDHYLILIE